MAYFTIRGEGDRHYKITILRRSNFACLEQHGMTIDYRIVSTVCLVVIGVIKFYVIMSYTFFLIFFIATAGMRIVRPRECSSRTYFNGECSGRKEKKNYKRKIAKQIRRQLERRRETQIGNLILLPNFT